MGYVKGLLHHATASGQEGLPNSEVELIARCFSQKLWEWQLPLRRGSLLVPALLGEVTKPNGANPTQSTRSMANLLLQEGYFFIGQGQTRLRSSVSRLYDAKAAWNF